MALRAIGLALFVAVTLFSTGCHHHRGCCKPTCCPSTCCGYLDVQTPPATLGAPK